VGSILLLAAVGLVLLVVAWRMPGKKHIEGLREGWQMAMINLPRVILALLAAGFLGHLMPGEIIAAWVGHESGLKGIAIATALGTIMPGGPLIAFPIVIILIKAGAGMPALVTFLTAWSVLGLQRIIGFELPMMGSKFVINRVAIAIFLPPLSGGMVYLLDSLF
jgi:uncharacterized membrane protein YraQ (UPF0718 family)